MDLIYPVTLLANTMRSLMRGEKPDPAPSSFLQPTHISYAMELRELQEIIYDYIRLHTKEGTYPGLLPKNIIFLPDHTFENDEDEMFYPLLVHTWIDGFTSDQMEKLCKEVYSHIENQEDDDYDTSTLAGDAVREFLGLKDYYADVIALAMDSERVTDVEFRMDLETFAYYMKQNGIELFPEGEI